MTRAQGPAGTQAKQLCTCSSMAFSNVFFENATHEQVHNTCLACGREGPLALALGWGAWSIIEDLVKLVV